MRLASAGERAQRRAIPLRRQEPCPSARRCGPGAVVQGRTARAQRRGAGARLAAGHRAAQADVRGRGRRGGAAVPRGRRRGAPRLDAQRWRLGGALGAAVGARRAERGGRRVVRCAAAAAQVRAHVVQHRLRAGHHRKRTLQAQPLPSQFSVSRPGCDRIPLSHQGSTAWCQGALQLSQSQHSGDSSGAVQASAYAAIACPARWCWHLFTAGQVYLGLLIC